MKNVKFIFLIILFVTKGLYGQNVGLEANNLVANKVYMSLEMFQGKEVVKVIKDSAVKEADEPTFVRIKNSDFKDGIIEVNVLSRLLPNASPSDRGFIGVAFRVNENNSKFECIYIRPTNGRAEEQVRRNHSIQYFSYSDFKFSRLRKETPEIYESYADMGLNEWIKIKIVVKGKQAKLFLNDNKQPSLIVNDLKHGEESSGAVGLFVDVGTEGYFSDLKIFKQ
ncbi:MAG: hypothetical protein ICV53_23415 [Flavisolibacter sp.]|nr:hypothetical protein [Flavisolibacter sp.]